MRSLAIRPDLPVMSVALSLPVMRCLPVETGFVKSKKTRTHRKTATFLKDAAFVCRENMAGLIVR
jgi:hypothetical protein